MPESKPRKGGKKKTPAQKRAAKKAAPKKAVVPPTPAQEQDAAFRVPAWQPRKGGGLADLKMNSRPKRDPIRPLEPEEKIEVGELPEPASYAQVLVALTDLDPLEQEVLIAQRISAMPSQKDGGMPVNIHRHVRPPWAAQLRKLGLFCIPELATHELVEDTGAGIMANHTAGRLKRITTDDFWNMAKQQNPELAGIVDGAKTPEQKHEAMQKLARTLPAEMRVAFDRLLSHNPGELTPK